MALFGLLPSPAEKFARRFTPLRDTVYDAEAMFSGSAMSQDLEALLPLAEKVGPESSELADLLWLQFVVYGKRQRDSEGLPLGLRALAIRSARGSLTPTDRYEQHYALGKSALQAEEYDTAVNHLQQAVEWSSHANANANARLSLEQKLGIREETGYALHEAGRYAEALAHNQQLLADAQIAFGTATDERLSGVINNLAQNAYELDAPLQANTYLQQRLTLGQALQDNDIILDTLFQQSVLAHEAGDETLARSLFEERIAIARATGDEDLLEDAQDRLDELISKT